MTILRVTFVSAFLFLVASTFLFAFGLHTQAPVQKSQPKCNIKECKCGCGDGKKCPCLDRPD